MQNISDTMAKSCKPFSTFKICNIKSIACTNLAKMAEKKHFCINYANYAKLIMRNISDTMAKSWRLFSTIIICNTRSIQCTKLKKKGFYAYWRPSIREITLKKIFSTIFVRAAVKHNENELEYAKSAKSNDFFSRYWPKTSFWAHFGPNFGPKHFFFKNPKTSLFYIYFRITWCKKIRKN